MAGKAGGPNLTRRIIDIPANNANPALIPIYATGPSRAWRLWESILTSAAAANTPQGFNIKIPNDGTVAGFGVTFGRPAASVTNEPGEFPSFENWNRVAEHGPVGEVFAGAGNSQAAGIGVTTATLICMIGSLTATGTSVEIVEYF